MNTFNHYSFDSMTDLTDTLIVYAEGGIDPAFDFECEELERQFAELRFTCNHD
jgi:hypothetical protein